MIVEVVVAVDHVELSVHARRLKLLAGGIELLLDFLVAHALAIFGEVAGDDHHIGLSGDDIGQCLVENVRALAEHLTIGVLGRNVIFVIAVERRREIVNVAH